MKKFFAILILTVILGSVAFYAFIYNVNFSEGVRSGELIKFSKKGFVMKTWEGEISQGISGAQIFSFSVEDKHKKVIYGLQDFQGKFVRVHYVERYYTFSWLGDSTYFVVKVEEDNSPHSLMLNKVVK